MKALIRWFAFNPVAANLLMIFSIASGLLSYRLVHQEIIPELGANIVNISVVYPGAAPAEVERGICVPIEEALQGVAGVERIRSAASTGLATVSVELHSRSDVARGRDEIQARIDAVDTFPKEIEEPIIQELVARDNVINVALWGNTDERTLRRLGERVREEISALPEVRVAELASVRSYEIAIEISEESLRRHGITFDDVVRAVRRSSLNLPGGSLESEDAEILLSTQGRVYDRSGFENLTLLARYDGTRVRLGEVARVVDGFARTSQAARLDGFPAVQIQVWRSGDQRVLEIADAVRDYVERRRARMPPGIHLTIWRDQSLSLRNRLDVLLDNGWMGLLLVLGTLAAFLRLRHAFWVSVGIPVALLGGLAAMAAGGLSLSLISIFAFILALGLVVDDAIVVGESIERHQRGARDPVDAAVAGTHRVAVPVVIASLTTMAASAPLLFLPGMIGRLIQPFPLIVMAVMLFSLIECLLVLPAHLSRPDSIPRHPALARVTRGFRRLERETTSLLEACAERIYLPLLRVCLDARQLTLSVALAVLLVAAGAVHGGWIRSTFLPKLEDNYVSALLTMPEGTPAEVTARAAQRLEKSALRARAEFETRPGDFGHVLTTIGDQPERDVQGFLAPAAWDRFRGSHLAQVDLQLARAQERDFTTSDVGNRWRELTGPIPEAEELSFVVTAIPAGDALDIQLSGTDLEDLRVAAQEVKARLTSLPGVREVRDSFRTGRREVRLHLKPQAEFLGLSVSDLARQIRQGFHGQEVQRIQREREEVPVVVRYPADERRSLGDLENILIRTPRGDPVPLAVVAEAEIGRSPAVLERIDRRRRVNVRAGVDERVTSANAVLRQLRDSFFPELIARHPGITVSLEGQKREERKALVSAAVGTLLAVLAIYTLLAVPLRSYAQPLIVLGAVPLSAVGAVLGHLILGLDLSVLTVVGMVALAGVVVNDSLLVLDATNGFRADGADPVAAVTRAASTRFRPVVLTSLTTFFALTPMLADDSVEAQFLMPMTVSLAFGVVFATAIALLLVPAAYLVYDERASGGALAAEGSPGFEPARGEDVEAGDAFGDLAAVRRERRGPSAWAREPNSRGALLRLSHGHDPGRDRVAP